MSKRCSRVKSKTDALRSFTEIPSNLLPPVDVIVSPLAAQGPSSPQASGGPSAAQGVGPTSLTACVASCGLFSTGRAGRILSGKDSSLVTLLAPAAPNQALPDPLRHLYLREPYQAGGRRRGDPCLRATALRRSCTSHPVYTRFIARSRPAGVSCRLFEPLY